MASVTNLKIYFLDAFKHFRSHAFLVKLVKRLRPKVHHGKFRDSKYIDINVISGFIDSGSN